MKIKSILLLTMLYLLYSNDTMGQIKIIGKVMPVDIDNPTEISIEGGHGSTDCDSHGNFILDVSSKVKIGENITIHFKRKGYKPASHIVILNEQMKTVDYEMIKESDSNPKYISGFVFGKSGPISDAIVYVSNKTDQTSVTDAQGKFSIALDYQVGDELEILIHHHDYPNKKVSKIISNKEKGNLGFFTMQNKIVPCVEGLRKTEFPSYAGALGVITWGILKRSKADNLYQDYSSTLVESIFEDMHNKSRKQVYNELERKRKFADTSLILGTILILNGAMQTICRTQGSNHNHTVQLGTNGSGFMLTYNF